MVSRLPAIEQVATAGQLAPDQFELAEPDEETAAEVRKLVERELEAAK